MFAVWLSTPDRWTARFVLLIALVLLNTCHGDPAPPLDGRAIADASDAYRAEEPRLVDGRRDSWQVSRTTLAVLGDIVEYYDTARGRANARLITSHSPPVTGALLLGDIVRYDPNYPAQGMSLLVYFNEYYKNSFEADWGQLDPIVFPALGNHEYREAGAKGYFEYYASRLSAIKAMPSYHGFADIASKGYYSFDLSGWHIIALNSNCAEVGGCGTGSPQESWLSADLAAHDGMPTIAYCHHPRYDCGSWGPGNNSTMQAFWADLYDARADFFLVGHAHFYQRWKPLDKAASATVDTAQGLTEFIVGNGGVDADEPCTDEDGKPLDPRVVAQIGGDKGIGSLFLTLGSDGSYAWEYRRIIDGAVFDAGNGLSHNAPAFH